MPHHAGHACPSMPAMSAQRRMTIAQLERIRRGGRESGRQAQAGLLATGLAAWLQQAAPYPVSKEAAPVLHACMHRTHGARMQAHVSKGSQACTPPLHSLYPPLREAAPSVHAWTDGRGLVPQRQETRRAAWDMGCVCVWGHGVNGQRGRGGYLGHGGGAADARLGGALDQEGLPHAGLVSILPCRQWDALGDAGCGVRGAVVRARN